MKKPGLCLKLLFTAAFAALFVPALSLPVSARFRFHYSSGNASVLDILVPGGALLVVAVVGVIVKRMRSKKKEEGKKPVDYTDKIKEEICSFDPVFNPYYVVRMGEDDFNRIITAVSDHDLEALRPFETEELFQRQETEERDLREAGRIRILSHAKILESYLHLYRRDRHYEYLTVCLHVEIKDYIISQQGYRLLDGTKDLQKQNYLLTYMRSKKTKTGDKTQDQTSCPNCGAPIQLNSSRQCPFCGAIIKADVFDWVLYDVETLGVKDVPDDRGILIEDNENVKFTKENSEYFTGYYDNGIEDPYKDPWQKGDEADAQFGFYREKIRQEQERINDIFPD